MKRTWKFAAIGKDAPAVIAAASSVSAAAKALGVSRDTLHTWIKRGLVPRPESSKRRPRQPARRGDRRSHKTFKAWALATYDFSRAELETLSSIEMAIGIRDDAGASRSERIQAAALVQRLLRDLRLPQEEEIENGDAEAPKNAPVPFPRKVG